MPERLWIAVLLAGVVAYPAAARDPLPPAIESVISAAYAAPPELAADALIQLAESPAIGDRAARLDLLEEAFALAGSARHSFKRWTAGLPLKQDDSDAGQLYVALDLGLSRLDLQCRATAAALSLDRARALGLFYRIPPPQPPALTCRDALAYRVDRYYDLAAELFQGAFTEKQRKRGEDVEFVGLQVGSITSPAQIEPVARMLGKLRLNADNYRALVGSLARATARLSADPRSFAATLGPGMLFPYLELANRCGHYGCSPVPLLEAMREYLATHLTGPRCADVTDDAVKKEAADFNAAVVQLTSAESPQPAPLVDEDLKSSGTGEQAVVNEFWSNAQTGPLVKSLLEAVLRRIADSRVSESDEEAGIRNFLNEFQAWMRDHQDDEASFFHQSAMIYEELIAGLAPGPLRAAVLTEGMVFLRDSPMLRDSPPEWYMHVRELLRRSGEGRGYATVVRDEVRRSGGPVIAMYLDLERVLSGAPEQTAVRPR